MKVILRDFSQNKGPDFHNLIPHQVYACLYEAYSQGLGWLPGRIIVSASLDYIAAVIRERKYELVRVEGQEVIR